MIEEGPLTEILEDLGRQGLEEIEVYAKRGRSRTLLLNAGRHATSLNQEEGWAVRAGDRRRSFYYAASGPPKPRTSWPEPDGLGLRLPSPRPQPSWTEPSELDVPLIGESEGQAFLEGLSRALDHELTGARLLVAKLEDGSSESQLISSRETRARVRQRAAALYLEAAGPRRGVPSVSLYLAERAARRFNPKALARRLTDRLLVGERGEAPMRDRGELLLAPPVAARMLAALAELWIGPEAERRCAALADRQGKIAAPVLTVIDNGRLPGGVFEAPVDGEGQPTREVVIVEAGGFRQPLLAWWQTTAKPLRASGCVLRPGWRDLPRPGPTHLYVRPEPTVAVSTLLAGIQRGYFLLDLDGVPEVDLDADRLALPVCGFAVESGRTTGAISHAWVVGAISSWLHGLVAVGRDLAFFPLSAGLVGSPSLLIKGLELRRRS